MRDRTFGLVFVLSCLDLNDELSFGILLKGLAGLMHGGHRDLLVHLHAIVEHDRRWLA